MQTSSLLFYETARKKHLRVTPALKAVYVVLESSNRPIPMQRIADGVEAAHTSSVYRTVARLHRGGLIRAVPLGLKVGYELAEQFKPHHHHATCERCGTTLEIHDQELEGRLRQLTQDAGLEPTKHYFEVFGVCKTCQSR